MKVTWNDVTITPRSGVGIVFDVWRAEPVFHGSRGASQTLCGRDTWDRERSHAIGTVLRVDHAAMIGRPCLRCWPELRGVAP